MLFLTETMAEETAPNANSTPRDRFWHLKIGILFFLITVALAVTIQTVIVPKYLSDRNAGFGLLALTDSPGFHARAKEIAEKIDANGWSEWTSGHEDYGGTTIGITSAIYALTHIHQPLSTVPFNAAVHAISAILILLMLRSLGMSRRTAVLGSLPFVLFPSAASWYAQVHRDGVVFLGFLITVWGWLRLVQLHKEQNDTIAHYVIATGIAFFGYYLAWFTRPYLVLVYQPLGYLIAGSLLSLSILKSQKSLKWRPLAYFTISVFALQTISAKIFTASQFTQMPSSKLRGAEHIGVAPKKHPIETKNKVQTTRRLNRKIQPETPDTAILTTPKGASTPQSDSSSPTSEVLQDTLPENEIEHVMAPPIENNPYPGKAPHPVCLWEPTSFLPDRAERAFFGVSNARNGFRNTNWHLDRSQDTDIDTEVGFCNAGEIIKYIPRAIQIGLFAPFPSSLFASRSAYAHGGFFRKIAAAEMSLVYLVLPFAVFFIAACYRKPEFWVILTFCLGLIVVEVLAITNLGTLYRHRFGFFMPILSFGVAGLCLGGRKAAYSLSSRMRPTG